jgi:hypothetical protein
MMMSKQIVMSNALTTLYVISHSTYKEWIA